MYKKRQLAEVDILGMHIQKIIQQLGYKQNEVMVYIASLQLGEATISDIAEKARLPRTSVQLIVAILQQRGLMNFYIKRRRKYWIAENPDRFLIQLKEREAALKETLPELHAMRHETGVKPGIRSYNGVDGIWQILNDILETKHSIRSLASVDDIEKLLGDNFKDFITHCAAQFLRTKLLTSRSSETMELKRKDSEELRQTRFLPPDFIIHNANFIYSEKVAIISLNKKMPVGIVIADKDITHTQTVLFDTLWEQGAAT